MKQQFSKKLRDDAIENLVYLSFSCLSHFKPSHVRYAKNLMNIAIDIQYAYPYNYGRGKGKYSTNYSIQTVIDKLKDESKAHRIANNYLNYLAKQRLEVA